MSDKEKDEEWTTCIDCQYKENCPDKNQTECADIRREAEKKLKASKETHDRVEAVAKDRGNEIVILRVEREEARGKAGQYHTNWNEAVGEMNKKDAEIMDLSDDLKKAREEKEFQENLVKDKNAQIEIKIKEKKALEEKLRTFDTKDLLKHISNLEEQFKVLKEHLIDEQSQTTVIGDSHLQLEEETKGLKEKVKELEEKLENAVTKDKIMAYFKARCSQGCGEMATGYIISPFNPEVKLNVCKKCGGMSDSEYHPFPKSPDKPEEKEVTRCPKCGGHMTLRLLPGTYQCFNCGYEPETEKKEPKDPTEDFMEKVPEGHRSPSAWTEGTGHGWPDDKPDKRPKCPMKECDGGEQVFEGINIPCREYFDCWFDKGEEDQNS